MPDANKYGGQDSWDDYDNSNMMTPAQQAVKIKTKSEAVEADNVRRRSKGGMASRDAAQRRLENIQNLQDPSGRQ